MANFRKDMVKTMKKRIVAVLVLVITLCVSGCGASSNGISQADYNAVVEERNAIQAELDEVMDKTVSKDEYDTVVKERDTLQKEIDKYKNKEKEAKAAAEAKEKEQQEKMTNGLTAGDSFEANGLKITIDKIDLEYWTYNEYYDSKAYGHGQKYVGVDFSVENVGTSDEGIYSSDFDCYADDALCDMATFYTGEYGSISPGRKTTFSLYWKVPEDADAIEVEYSYHENLMNKMVMIKLK